MISQQLTHFHQDSVGLIVLQKNKRKKKLKKSKAKQKHYSRAIWEKRIATHNK